MLGAGGGGGGEELVFKFPFFKMKDILEMEGGNGCTVSLYLMPLNCPLKMVNMVNFMLNIL